MKVLVTGASGFIGTHTLPLLEHKGYTIFPISSEVDLKDPNQCTKLMEEIQPHYLLHLAWETAHGQFWHARSNTVWLTGAIALLESFALQGGQRAVIAGSCAELTPTTLYGACKESLRLIAEPLLHSYDVSMAWGRIFFPYGPYEKAGRLIPSLISALRNQTPFSCSSPNTMCDYLYVEDVAAALVFLLESKLQGTIEIGSGEGIAVGDLVDKIAKKLDASHLIKWEHAETPHTFIANPDRLKKWGWEPSYTLETGIDQTIKWWNNALHN